MHSIVLYVSVSLPFDFDMLATERKRTNVIFVVNQGVKIIHNLSLLLIRSLEERFSFSEVIAKVNEKFVSLEMNWLLAFSL